jgi:hypothetical protein
MTRGIDSYPGQFGNPPGVRFLGGWYKSLFFSFDAILLLPASTHAQRPRELAFPGIAADGIFDRR